MSENRLSKLPKWAIEHIENLTRERDIAKESLRDFTDNQSFNRLSFSSVDDKVCFIQSDRVKFTIDDKKVIEVILRDDYLELYSHHGSIVIQPRASNVAKITTESF